MNAAEISRVLSSRKAGVNFLVRCPAHDDRSPSCSIRDGDDDRLLVWCFAGCDGVDVLRAFRAQGFFDDETRTAPTPPRRAPATPIPSGLRWSPKADAIWHRAQPITGTLAEVYLRGRGCAVPGAADLRFAPADHRFEWPSLIARITDLVTGEPMSLHFTRLARDGQGKAPVDKPRLLLAGHAKAGGVVRLTGDDEVTSSLGLGEGFETCLTQLPQFGVCRDVKSADLLGFR